MADKKKMEAVRRRMVQVSPQEMIAREGDETDEQVKARYKKEQAALAKRMRENAADSRFYAKTKDADPFTRAGLEVERKLRKKLGYPEKY